MVAGSGTDQDGPGRVVVGLGEGWCSSVQPFAFKLTIEDCLDRDILSRVRLPPSQSQWRGPSQIHITDPRNSENLRNSKNPEVDLGGTTPP